MRHCQVLRSDGNLLKANIVIVRVENNVLRFLRFRHDPKEKFLV